MIAQVAQEKGIFTVGVVTKPGLDEGPRQKLAQAGIDELSLHVDSLIIVSNQKLEEVLGDDVTIDEAFRAADDVLRDAVGSVVEIIYSSGVVNVDFAAVQAMVQQAQDAWGRVDILVNNAGILRDKSFAKMDMADFALVVQVHLMGAAHCCKAVWPLMQAQNYGRIVMTTSSTGLYGNFGQANYGAAKLAQAGLMHK